MESCRAVAIFEGGRRTAVVGGFLAQYPDFTHSPLQGSRADTMNQLIAWLFRIPGCESWPD
jgi:hypothetical protein